MPLISAVLILWITKYFEIKIDEKKEKKKRLEVTRVHKYDYLDRLNKLKSEFDNHRTSPNSNDSEELQIKKEIISKIVKEKTNPFESYKNYSRLTFGDNNAVIQIIHKLFTNYQEIRSLESYTFLPEYSGYRDEISEKSLELCDEINKDIEIAIKNIENDLLKF